MTDSTNVICLIKEIQPDEIYNLTTISPVAVSFETPKYLENYSQTKTILHRKEFNANIIY